MQEISSIPLFRTRTVPPAPALAKAPSSKVATADLTSFVGQTVTAEELAILRQRAAPNGWRPLPVQDGAGWRIQQLVAPALADDSEQHSDSY